MTTARSYMPMVLVLLAVTTSQAGAQERGGLIGGLSLGLGALHIGGASTDPAAELVSDSAGREFAAGASAYLGGSMTPRAAILFEVAVMALANDTVVDGEVRVGPNRVTFPISASSLTSVVFAGAFQYSLTSRLWIRGGIGAGYLDRDLVVEAADLTVTLSKTLGTAVLGAAGVDLWRRGNFALDAQFHYTWFALEGLRVHAPSGQVGFTWY